ncbi:hemolysin family protein [Psychrobacillus psychrodurans]|uniref:Hemolysin family protein n=1 Tax=Psychrobacillus psychrodurans TaxID=126157 RepID=A0A9X3L8T9_9BACI|nr:hemolysin family protein [Psychrobacillus psychrodurans]MCK1998178.1 hemolysin family protein [Psychrobacillus psychrodurans]MCZ8533513.1 hemolysin family protein [Psychrobacillus psychrodurans]MCZ8541919.1 hemolysin family protein [Psychrobacillus psychrodurans]SFN14890.1 Hemolysin, contains CBS domains [Psychrobacillus psychrodurans]
MDIAIRLTAFAVLIAFTAFFVASEFAIVKVRTTRIDQLIAEGNTKAINAKKVVSNLDEYLSACQLGITITALGLGWLGEPTIERILHPAFNYFELPESVASLLSFIIAFSLVTYIHVVVGELTPKTFAIQRSEQITLAVAKPLIIFDKLMYPVIHGMNGSARFLATKVFGLDAVSESEVAHSEEELRMILSDSFKGGEINQAEYKYVNKIFEFDDRIAKEIMVPRTEITSIDKDFTLDEVFQLIGVEQYTRYPITDGDKDHIIGLVNMKNLLTAYIKDPTNATTPVSDYMQPIIRVIENMPIADLLLKIQRERIHMAILMDEYGGTSGLVTIEDIIEEIVGDIRDEFDTDELPEVQKLEENHYIVDAKMLIENVNDLLGIDIDEEDIDTIGGWFMTKSYETIKGEKIQEQGYDFMIKEVDGHHIQYLEIIKSAPPVEELEPIVE